MHSFHSSDSWCRCLWAEFDRMLSVFFVKNYAGFYSSRSEEKGKKHWFIFNSARILPFLEYWLSAQICILINIKSFLFLGIIFLETLTLRVWGEALNISPWSERGRGSRQARFRQILHLETAAVREESVAVELLLAECLGSHSRE